MISQTPKNTVKKCKKYFYGLQMLISMPMLTAIERKGRKLINYIFNLIVFLITTDCVCLAKYIFFKILYCVIARKMFKNFRDQ